jgi:hypothetical protein
MPKAKPVSLYPLSFDEAINALIRVDVEHVGYGSKKTKNKHPKKKNKND